MGILASSSWRYRQDIDGLRALAVAIVILFHLQFSWLPGGFVGVDVFFVISGFLITSLIVRQIADGRFSLIDFYERRFRRIYPNLLIVLTVTAILGFIAMVPLTYRPFGRSLIWATLSASNFAFIGGNGYFDPDNLTKPLLHTWSLGAEEQFYLVFPWLLILAANRGYSVKWLIGGIVGLSLALSIGAAFADWDASYFLLPTRFWELGIGALIAILPPGDRLSMSQRSLLGFAGLLAIGWAALRLTDSDPFPGYLALAPTLGAAAVIWANGGLAGRVLSFRPFVWIGRLSFALYLWHWPLISIAAGIGLPPTNTSTRIVIVVVMLALSLVGYFLWEQPIRQRRLLAGRKALFAALGIFVVVLVIVGVAIFQTKGVPQRLPRDLVAMEEIARKESYLIAKRCPAIENQQPASCPLGDETVDRVSFAIMGDSHAQAVAAEVGDIAKAHHLRGVYLGKGGCPPLADLDRHASPVCPLQYEYALSEIRKYNPPLVIIISQWTGLIGAPFDGYKLFKNGELVSSSERYKIIEEDFDKLLTALEGHSIVTALPFPEYQNKAPYSWELWTERLGFPSRITELTYSEHLWQQTYAKKLLIEAKERYKNLTVLDPSTKFCPTICIRAIGNEIFYRDDTHLSHAGALFYAPLFEPIMSKLADQENNLR